MGSVAGEAIFVPKTISDFLREVLVIGDVSEKVSRVNSFVDALEEEVRRIDALKRELPLCMLLLKDAILVLKEERLQRASLNKVPVLEEFIPVKKTSGEDNGQVKRTEDSKDMKNWMSSVQLWKTEDDVDAKENLELESCKINDKVNQGANQDIFQTYKSRSAAGTFILFKGCTSLSRKEEESPAAGPGLSLFTPGNKSINEEDSYSSDNGDRDRAVCVSSSVTESSLRIMFQQQNDRKQRRCWSPELHRCFVNALQQLGGSEAATPKHIRELMQVDGLTNDEVKSHLQKYRLHTKRIGTARATLEHQFFLGSLWMPQVPYVDSLKPTSSQSGSPQGPLQLTGNTGGTSITGGDSTEDGEDAKSEDYSWKGSIHR